MNTFHLLLFFFWGRDGELSYPYLSWDWVGQARHVFSSIILTTDCQSSTLLSDRIWLELIEHDYIRQRRIQDFRRRGRQLSRRGRRHTIFSKFPKNCMKLRKFWAMGGGGGGGTHAGSVLPWICQCKESNV